MDNQWLISADSHVLEPDDLFTKPLGKKWGDAVPQYVNEYRSDKSLYYFTGIEYVKIDEIVEKDEGGLQDELLTASKDPHFRLKCLDRDGVYAEILNATWMLYTLRVPDDDMVQDCCQVYNDWMHEMCSADPKRLFGTAMIHMAKVEWAVKELERAAKLGLKSVIINVDTRPEWPFYQDPLYDPFWAKAEELDMPITLHIITGNVRDLFTYHGEERIRVVRDTLSLLSEVGPVLGNEFIFGGILDRFPRLKIVCSEFEVSWLPYWLFRIKQLQDSLGAALNIKMPKLPVEQYMPRIHHGVVDDTQFDKILGVIDPKQVMWGSDFPHSRCTYPNSQQVIEDVFGHLDGQIVADLTFYSAARYYDIEVPKDRAIAAE